MLGLAATGLVGACARAGLATALTRLAVASIGVAAVVAWGAPDVAHADGPFVAAAALACASGVATLGLASLGRALRCPDPGAGVVAGLVLLAGLLALGWVDAVAEEVRPEARTAVRQAVLRADLATAAAYDVARHDRLHEPAIYDTSTIASLPVELPRALPAAAGWAAAGGLGLSLAGFVRIARRRRAPMTPAPRGAIA